MYLGGTSAWAEIAREEEGYKFVRSRHIFTDRRDASCQTAGRNSLARWNDEFHGAN